MAGRKKREGPVVYSELPRKQLQSLCKKYGYPANRTNQLMAQFLTSHLNSDEYLSRDKSQPSPAVKTRFQCSDEERATDDTLSTISESQPANFETEGRRLSHEFMDLDAAHTVSPLEAPEPAETSLETATADNTRLTMLESQSAKVEAEGIRVSHEFMDTDTPHTDCPLEACKSTGVGQTDEETIADNTLSTIAESAPANVETDGSMLSHECTVSAHFDLCEASESAGTVFGQINQIKSLDIETELAETDQELDIERTADAVEYVSKESQRASEDSAKSEEKAAEEPRVALSFLDIDFTEIKVQHAGEGPKLEIDSTNFTEQIRAGKPTPLSPLDSSEQIRADKPTPLSPLDSNRMAMDTTIDSSPPPTTPTKSVGILEVLREVEEKENTNGFSYFGKENEWLRRQELHKTPLTGKSKEKALRTAEKQACNLREQLLKKRRGMMMKEQIDGYNSS